MVENGSKRRATPVGSVELVRVVLAALSKAPVGVEWTDGRVETYAKSIATEAFGRRFRETCNRSAASAATLAAASTSNRSGRRRARSTATATRWNDVVTAFGPRGVDPAWCWCRRFLDGHRVAEAATGNRDALLREVSTAPIPPGLIAYVDGTPAGWTRVMPRHDLPGVMANRALRRLLTDDAGAWWVTCFAIQRQYRNIGVARTLLDAAVVHARPARRHRRRGPPRRYWRPPGRTCERLRAVHGNDATVRRRRFQRDRPHLSQPPVMRRQL